MTLPTSFHKVLIANRGEIALRVMRSARALGYRTVAVYSTADANARHVCEADEAVCIGEPLPAQSYLCIPAIIEAARKTGADAVHPGYGFLAENDAFARACRDAGLVFIGPSPEAIVAMGNKAGAKRLMQEAGVPCVPGYQGEDQDEDRLAAEAARIGFPVMIKATAGGGGRGMRLVESAATFRDLLRSAQSEAQNAFGSPEVILERAIVEPRHIEIQVFADRQGNAIHLDFAAAVSEGKAPNNEYSRYWHGSQVLLRPLLTFLSIQGCRLALFGLLMALLVWLAVRLVRMRRVRVLVILLIGLLKTDEGSGGFVFIDEPFAHLDIRNIQLVGEFLKNTDAQYLMTTPLTHNTDVYDPSELTLITSKKLKTMPWAQPIFVLQRRKDQGGLKAA